MGTELSLPASFGQVSQLLSGAAGVNDDLGAGIASSYCVVGFKGKVWSMRFGGDDKPLMREDGDGPRNSIEVVLVKAAAPVSKIYYKGGYVDGSTAAPDCWSASGVAPDTSVQNKVNPTCADCPMNAWGSRISEAGKAGKQCADSRRVSVVPAEDMANELFGGPMLLRIPAASLKDLKAYGDLLNSYSFPYYGVVTRISFDPTEAYPKFVFSAVRPLTDIEAKQSIALRSDKRVATVLNEAADMRGGAGVVPAADDAEEVPASPFEKPAEVVKPKPAAKPKPAPVEAKPAEPVVDPEVAAAEQAKAEKAKRAAAAKLAAEEAYKAAMAGIGDEDEEEGTAMAADEETTSGGSTQSFDDLLDKLLD